MFSEFDLLQRYPFSDPEPVLVDVGAHHGHLSRLFAALKWRVIAFEPESVNWQVLMRSTARFDSVTCIKRAVSDATGAKVPFYVSKEHFGIHSLKPFHKTHSFAYEVETTTLDDALQQLGVTNVTLLKIDIEGADFLALKGFNIRNFQPEMVMLEFMDERTKQHFGYTHHDIVSHMKSEGFACLVSEWAPVKEYAREGEQTTTHQWLGCMKYPLNHAASWGNLIFVPVEKEDLLRRTLEDYVFSLSREGVQGGWFKQIRSIVAKIPGARKLYQFLMGS